MYPGTLLAGIKNRDQIGHDPQGHFDRLGLEFWEIRLVRSLTRHGFELESPNLH